MGQRSGVRSFYSIFCILTSVFFILIAGCAAPPPVKEETVFYPASPELPRIQFLTSFTGAKDIEAEKSAFESFITGEKESERRLDKPYGVAIYGGKIYVCDTNGTVMVFDLEKRTYGPLQGAQGLGKLVQPLNISIDKDGFKYVTDPIRGQVVIFDKNDFYVKALGAPGKWKPIDAVSFEDLVYVADIMNGEVRVFDKKTGEIVKRFGDKGKPDEGLLDKPINLTFDKDGTLYVVDAGRFQIVKFDRDGHFKGVIGKHGTNIGHFGRPRGVASDREDRIYAVDASFNNVQVFTTENQNLFWFGEMGKKAGRLILPAQVFIDYDNMKYFEKYVSPNFEMEYLVLVTSQFGDRMVNIFAFGKEKGRKYPTNEELRLQMIEKLKKETGEQPAQTEEGEKGKKEEAKPQEKGKEETKPSEIEKAKEQTVKPVEIEKGKEETTAGPETEKAKEEPRPREGGKEK